MGQSNRDNNRDTVRKQMSQNLREQYVQQFQKAMEQDVGVPYNAKTLYLRESLIEEEFKGGRRLHARR